MLLTIKAGLQCHSRIIYMHYIIFFCAAYQCSCIVGQVGIPYIWFANGRARKPDSSSSQTWWRHQMETFSALLAHCAGNSSVPVNSPHKSQWRGALMFSLICVWINDWVNNRETGDLRRHRGHYDVNVMFLTWPLTISVYHVAPTIHYCQQCIIHMVTTKRHWRPQKPPDTNIDSQFSPPSMKREM